MRQKGQALLCTKCHKRKKIGTGQYCRKCRTEYMRMYRREKQMCVVCRYKLSEVDFDNHPLFGRNIFTTAHNILNVVGEIESRLGKMGLRLEELMRGNRSP